MNFFKWLRGSNDLELENQKLRSANATLHSKMDDLLARDTKNVQRKEQFAEELRQLRRQVADGEVGKVEALEHRVQELHMKLSEKEREVATFMEEIARLKKLIAESKNMGTPPVNTAAAVDTAQLSNAGGAEHQKGQKNNSAQHASATTDHSATRASVGAEKKTAGEVAAKAHANTKHMYVKGKGNDRTPNRG